MAPPVLTKPVKRPDLVDPTKCVDLDHGPPEDIAHVTLLLRLGANYNDPAAIRYPGYRQVMSSALRGWRS
jgi:cyanobactin biosynthesis protein (PatB/AcyB/McaB family)